MIFLFAGIGLAAGTGCSEPGPAEKAGNAIDEAIEDAEYEAEDAKKKKPEALE